jgi:hypothetical protein
MSDGYSLLPLAQAVGGFLIGAVTVILPLLVVLLL